VTELVHGFALDAGVPPEIWQLVYGDAELVGNALVDTADYVAFTGSTATGRKVASRASARLIGYSLELGGKNPMIVLPGAELGKAAELAIAGAFGNSGQLCVSIERLYVANQDKERLLLELAARVNSLKLGTTASFDHDLGPLYSAKHLERVQKIVEQGLKQGGRLIAGGTALPKLGANYYAPTIIADLPNDSDLTREEVFGPVIVVNGYDDVADAVRLANDSEYGLNASVIGPIGLAKQVAKQLRFGSVNINEGYRASMSSMDAPMGGMKNSGVGRRSGKSGLLRFTEPRTVSVAKSWPIALPTRASQYVKMAPLMNALAKFQGR
jgi:succinate-semialdehyde dehydrogenase/glutarate-semialdehyde dehydrogenase